MKNQFLIFLLLISTFTFAQTKDNFAVTKNYLLQIKEAVDYAPNTKKQKIAKLNRVINQGSKQCSLLEKQIKTNKNEKEQQQIIQEFNLILQAVILLKTDINENVPLSGDIEYLNTNIPVLLKKLN